MKLFVAYLDPGTGSLILQAAIGAVAGIGLFFRQSIGRFFGGIGKSSKKDEE